MITNQDSRGLDALGHLAYFVHECSLISVPDKYPYISLPPTAPLSGYTSKVC